MTVKAKSPFAPGFDALSSRGANVLGRHIESVWANRGHRDVRAFIFEVHGMPGNYGVRSNLVCGMPPRVARAHPFAAVSG